MKRETLDDLLRARAARRPVVLLTWLDDGRQRLWRADDDTPALCEELVAACRVSLRDDRSLRVETAEGPVFVQAHCPRLRLLIVGAVHIAQALAPMAALAGFDVTVIDPRSRFASTQRFPGVTLERRWPHEALRALEPDGRTAVVTLSHDAKLDDAALQVALDTEAFYVAALGSRRTHAARLARLRERGVNETSLARVHAPAGLDISARGSAEIAVSVLAQAIAVLRAARPD